VRYHYTSLERWQTIAEADELSVSDVLVNGELPLRDDTRVRIAVRMRRDARRRVRVPSTRWREVIDRAEGVILWLPPLLVCPPPCSALIEAPPST